MDTPEFKDMDVEYTRTPGKEDLNQESVFQVPPEEDLDERPELHKKAEVSDSLIDGENPKQELRKLKKSEIRLNKKYENLRNKFSKWIDKQEDASEKAMQKRKLVNDLQELIQRSVEQKESGKNIALLKKAMKSMKKGLKEKTGVRKIKKKIRKLEKKMGRIESQLA